MRQDFRIDIVRFQEKTNANFISTTQMKVSTLNLASRTHRTFAQMKTKFLTYRLCFYRFHNGLLKLEDISSPFTY